MERLSKCALVFFFVLVIFAPVVFAEDITITTYYPSPYGSYNELQLYPHASPATSCDASHKGTMYYDSDDSQIKVCDGASWTTAALGGMSYTHYCFTNAGYGSPVCTNAGGSQGFCPAGYKQKSALGSWGYCYFSGDNFLLPPGGSCGASGSYVVGSAYVCSN